MQKIYPLFPILEISFKTSAGVMNLFIVHNCLILGVNKNWPKDCLQSIQCKYLLVIGFVFQLFYLTGHLQPERGVYHCNHVSWLYQLVTSQQFTRMSKLCDFVSVNLSFINGKSSWRALQSSRERVSKHNGKGKLPEIRRACWKI